MREQITGRPFYFLGSSLSLTVSTTVVSALPSSIPAGASGVLLANAVGAGDVHWLPGTDPSTLWGVPLRGGDALLFRDNPATLPQLRFVRVGATDGRISFVWLTE